MNHRLLTPNLKAVIENYPLYSQDNKGLDAVVGEVFGIGRARWYILEASYEGEDIIMFGIVNGLGPDIEYGYISLTELEDIEVKPIPQCGLTIKVEAHPYFTADPLSNISDKEVIDFVERIHKSDE